MSFLNAKGCGGPSLRLHQPRFDDWNPSAAPIPLVLLLQYKMLPSATRPFSRQPWNRTLGQADRRWGERGTYNHPDPVITVLCVLGERTGWETASLHKRPVWGLEE